MDELTYKKIKNYLRKASSNNNDNTIKIQLLGLYYSILNGIPINKKIEIDSDEYKNMINNFPDYFKDVSRDKIIEIFNKQVSPKKPLQIENDDYIYDISAKKYLEICPNTFRPYYKDDWKLRATNTNNLDVSKQYSFFADYLRYFLKYNKFPTFTEFINYVYNRYNKPVHKDILTVYTNIYDSYVEVISCTKYSNEEIRRRIIISTPIKNRLMLQAVNNDK
jgi:hypothetical protein